MTNVQEYHSRAMDLAEMAVVARIRGDLERSEKLFREAFENEKHAAALLEKDLASEPSRSVIHRSAASLALKCRETREAERLIAIALSGNPQEEIADELRDLLEQVNFNRHLDLRGITLYEDEFQLSLSGKAIGYGMALSDHLITRVQNVERLIYRTVERMTLKPFRERGTITKSLREGYELFVSAPRASSFAVSLKIGRPLEQFKMPGLDFSADVIDELMTCLEMINEARQDELRKRMPEEPYYTNFISLARQIAPDGDQIRQVGFTTIRRGIERRVSLIKPRDEISLIPKPPLTEEHAEYVSVEGQLLFADATKRSKGQIRLVDEKGAYHHIIVPEGMMADIVRPLWEYTVVVNGIRIGKEIRLQDIKKSTE